MTFAVPLEDVVKENRNELLSAHANWERVRLGDVVEVLNGYPFPSDQFSKETGTPLLRIRDVVRGRTKTYFVGEFEPSYVVNSGELVVGMDGDFNCARWRGEAALLNQRVCKLTPNPEFLDPSFLDKVLPGYLNAINAATSSMTVKHLSSRTIADIPLPLPSRSEQRRLAEKLDELLSDLDAGIAALERARANLKRYRAAVLKAAVEGRLTEKWRAAQPKVEPAEKLLERILVGRRKKWEEAQLKKFAEKGQKTPKGWKDRYSEPARPDVASLPALPQGWCWASIDQCALGDSNAISDGPFGSNLKSEHYTDSGPRVIRLQNIGDGEFVDASAHISLERYRSLKKHLVSGRDVVIAMLGEVLPRACVIPDHVPPAIVKADCAKVSFNNALCLPEYANCALNSEMVRKRAAGSIKGVGRPRLNLSHIREVPIPLPPLKEQLEIWAAVSAAIESSRHQDREAATSITRSARLRQSILKRAFEGKLVPQDPKDEPASELLARVRAMRAAGQGRGGRSGGVRK